MRREILMTLGLVSLFILGGIAGYFLNERECKDYKKEIAGLYLRNWNETEVKNYTKTREPRGDWVCVNVRGMTPKRALEVCRHEVGHEIFAEYCEQSQEGFDRCMEVIEDEGDN